MGRKEGKRGGMEGETEEIEKEGEGMCLERHIWAAQCCWCFFIASFLLKKERSWTKRD